MGVGGERTIGFDPGFGFGLTLVATKGVRMVGPNEAWYANNTPVGPSTLNLVRSGSAVRARAWGPGSEFVLEQAPKLLGSLDLLDGFDPQGPVERLWRRTPFLMARTDRLWDALVIAIVGQKVQTVRAKKSRNSIAHRFGELAPGPTPEPMWVMPTAQTVASMSYADFHPANIERRRADTLIRTAAEMPRLTKLSQLGPAVARARLERIRGIGPWTSAMATSIAFGDADAIPTGDYHLPNTVGWLLAQKERSNDNEMLELLKPYTGHRWRVARLAESTGHAPRRGAKLTIREFSDN